MNWLVRWTSQALRWWLKPPKESNRRGDLGGAALMFFFYGVLVLAFYAISGSLNRARPYRAHFYSQIGRPRVDPELVMRMLIVGYCRGIRSERRLCEDALLSLAYRSRLFFHRHAYVGVRSQVSDRGAV